MASNPPHETSGWGSGECKYRHMHTYNAYNTIYMYMYRLQLVPVSKDGIEKIYS